MLSGRGVVDISGNRGLFCTETQGPPELKKTTNFIVVILLQARSPFGNNEVAIHWNPRREEVRKASCFNRLIYPSEAGEGGLSRCRNCGPYGVDHILLFFNCHRRIPVCSMFRREGLRGLHNQERNATWLEGTVRVLPTRVTAGSVVARVRRGFFGSSSADDARFCRG